MTKLVVSIILIISDSVKISIPILTYYCTILTFEENTMKNELVRVNVPNAHILIKKQSAFKKAGSKLCELHYHDEIELISITSGELVFSVNSKPQVCRTGDIIFFSPRIPHITYNSEFPCTYTLLQFRLEHYLDDTNNIGKYFNRFINNAEKPFAVIHNEELSHLIEKTLQESQSQTSGFELLIKGAIYAMLAILCRESAITLQNNNVSCEIEKLRPSIAYIEQNYAKDISLEEISDVQKVKPSYFCRLFKKASGSSFIDYLNFVRICKSEKLLAKSEKSILDVAYEVGFSSSSYYNRMFKRYKNCTPTEYRRAQCLNN